MATLLVAGCATSQEELMPVGDTTMMEIWQNQAGHSTGERRLLDVRSELRRPWKARSWSASSCATAVTPAMRSTASFVACPTRIW
ncbi:hypothetical protein [Halomonas sp. E19]|uniref:hypothetical protein n=1 Tax=Halomonas sp. E19 TaxID=3397247 RepID=UPI00403481A7